MLAKELKLFVIFKQIMDEEGIIKLSTHVSTLIYVFSELSTHLFSMHWLENNVRLVKINKI